MKHIAELNSQELKWDQPSAMKMEYLLLADGEAAASLKFRSSFGSLATAESADGAWTFKRVGFFETRVTVRPRGSEQEIAHFRNNTWTNGGTLFLDDGRAYRATTNFWMTKYEFLTENDEILLEYRRIGGFFRLSSMMVIHPAGMRLRELPWMAMLGWYLTVLLHQDSVTAAAITAS